MEKYQFDKNLMGEGWSKMNVILDKEMPVEKKKRRAFIFWFSAVSGIAATIFLSWLALSYLSVFNKNESKNTLATTQNVEAATKANTIPNITKSTTKNNNIQSKKVTKQQDLSYPKNISKFIKIQNKNIQNTDLQYLINSNNNNVIVSDEINPLNAGKVQNTTSVENTRQNIDLFLIENPKKLTEISHENQEKTLDLTHLKTNVKSKRSYQIGVFIGANKNHTSLGVSANFGGEMVGLKYAKRVKKHLFEASLSYENVRRFTPIYYQEKLIPIQKISTAIPEFVKVDDVVYPWNCNCYGDYPAISDEYKTYPSFVFTELTHQIGIGVAYSYRLSKRWELNSGLNVTKNIGNVSYSVVSTDNSVEIPIVINTTYVSTDTSLFDNLNKKASSYQINSLNVFKKYDVFASLGASFYMYKNLKISILRRQGFIDLTPNDIFNRRETSKYWQVQLTKYF